MTRTIMKYLCVFLVAIAPVGVSIAQEETSKDEFILEEIVVTSQRRAENLQNVAIAATAILDKELLDKAVTNFTDLQFAAPSLSITDGMLTKNVNIRGVGLASGDPAATNGVATYVDGVFQPPIVNTQSFFDMQGVEVLRGPQGTFVGSSSTGGALFMNSRNPSLDGVNGYVQGGYGDYNLKEFQGAINVPISSFLAFRAAGNYRNRDSFYKDIGVYHNEPGGLDEKAFRIGGLVKTDRFEALLKVFEDEKDTGGFAVQPLGTFASGADIFTLNYNSPTKTNEKAHQSTLEMKYTLPGDIVLRTMSGFQDRKARNLIDTDGTATQLNTIDQTVREKVHTEEINLISPTDGRFDYILGAYYQQNDVYVDIFIAPFVDVDSYNDKLTTAAFGQMGYKLTDTLKLDFGVRHTRYDVSQEGTTRLMFVDPPIEIDLGSEHDDSETIGKLALNWNIDSNNLLYGFISKGYKPGGANSADDTFDPEIVYDYEIGWKSILFNGHVRTQLGAFWMDYQDFQQGNIDLATGQGGLRNIGDATIRGIEISAQTYINGLGFDLAYNYLDTEMDDFEFVNQRLLPPGVPTMPSCEYGGTPDVSCTDYTGVMENTGGGPMLYAPEHTFNASVNYTFYLPNGVTVRPSIHYSFIGEQWLNLLYDPEIDLMGSREIVNVRVNLSWREWDMEVYCHNLADEIYVFGTSDTETYNDPRQIGVNVSYRF